MFDLLLLGTVFLLDKDIGKILKVIALNLVKILVLFTGKVLYGDKGKVIQITKLLYKVFGKP